MRSDDFAAAAPRTAGRRPPRTYRPGSTSAGAVADSVAPDRRVSQRAPTAPTSIATSSSAHFRCDVPIVSLITSSTNASMLQSSLGSVSSSLGGRTMPWLSSPPDDDADSTTVFRSPAPTAIAKRSDAHVGPVLLEPVDQLIGL